MFKGKMKIIRGVAIVMLVGFLHTACASNSRYVKAPTALPPELEISASDDNLRVDVNYLIIPDGLGAWVKEARWDEYFLTVRNLSDGPLTVEKIRLIDPRGVYIKSGVDPAQLETLSDAMIDEYKDLGISVAITAAPTVVAGAAMAAGAFGAAAGMVVLAPVAFIAGPTYYFVKKHADQKDREAVEKEFTRRNLTTFTLSGNATIEGSSFYPIIPNPKALVVDYRVGSKVNVLEVSLEKLKGLHVAPTARKEEKKKTEEGS